MSCRKPQNVVCHKFCPHTKYLKACKYYFKNKSIASLRVEYLFATLHAKVSANVLEKIFAKASASPAEIAKIFFCVFPIRILLGVFVEM